MISTLCPSKLLFNNHLILVTSLLLNSRLYIAYQLLTTVLVMFKQTTRLYQLLGKTKLEDLPPSWQGPMDRVLKREEQGVSNPMV